MVITVDHPKTSYGLQYTAVNMRYFSNSINLAFNTYTKDFKGTIMAQWIVLPEDRGRVNVLGK
jgi:hypothetical protein